MPRILRRDSDGDVIFAKPRGEKGWDLDADPTEMFDKTLCAAVARDILRCKIKWWGYYCDWVCSCKGTPHGYDSQCSIMASSTQLFGDVIDVCKDEGIALVADRPTEFLRTALIVWRATA